MAVLAGKDGALAVGASSSATMITYVTSWTLNKSVDEYTQKPLSQDYTSRVTGHTDWTATCEFEYDSTDAQQAQLLTEGTAVVPYFYLDEDTPKYYTGTGVITAVTPTVSGTAINSVSVTIGGNGAISLV